MSYIGIDLGTTFCCTAVTTQNVQVIKGEDGKNLIASRVFFPKVGSEPIVGNGADAQKKGSGIVIYDSKRLIGRKYNEAFVQKEKGFLNYEIEGNKETNDVVIKIPLEEGNKEYKPEEISSFLLKKIKSYVNTVLGEVKGAVITVPAYFGNSQREKTKKAAELAGLNVIEMIDEPTAAAIAYGCENEEGDKEKEKILLVYDFGGGTFDVSIIKVNHPKYEVLCVGGDSHLGGEDITNNILKYFCDLYEEETDEDLRKTKPLKMKSLKSKCEALKIDLSSLSETDLEFDFFENVINCKMSLSTFNEINKKLFDHTIDIVKDTINRSKVKLEDINEIVLVGGSCRNKRVKEILKENFDKILLKEDLNPDEIVAKGAAILANNYNQSHTRKGCKVLVQNIVIHSLGIEISNDKICRMIDRGMERGVKKSKVFSNTTNTEFRFVVCEGESDNVSENTIVGLFKIDGFPPSPIGEIKIKVIFEVDQQGMLNISVYNSSYGLNKTIIYNL